MNNNIENTPQFRPKKKPSMSMYDRTGREGQKKWGDGDKGVDGGAEDALGPFKFKSIAI